MSEWKFDQLTDLSHLLSATTNIVVSDIVEVALLVLALDWLTLAVYHRILRHNTELWWIYLDNLEFDLSHTTSACEKVALTNGSVGLAEVWSKEDVEEGASKTFDGVGHRKDSNALGLKKC